MAPVASSNPNHDMNALFSRALYRIAQALTLFSLAASMAWAVSPFIARDIRIEGLQRVEPGTVFATLPFRVGETYTDEKGTAAIRALFGLGLFKDIRIEVKDDVVVVLLEERPIIASIDFIGTKEFDKEALRKALKEIGLSDGRPYDRSLADLAEQDIKRQYVNRSLYGVDIVTTITPVERNRVNLTFNVTEGDMAKIKQIQFVGNKVFKSSTLEDLMDLNSGNWMSWYTKSDRYSRPKLNADLETLRSFYLARGYLDFRIDSTQVSISPNKQDLSVTINIFEGEMFAVSSVRLQGYYLGKDDEFKTMIGIKVGQAYNAEDVTKTTAAFTEYFGNFGFAFARVEAVNEIDRSTNRVALVLQADPSRRAYVRKINLTGNSRTRDEIIRRQAARPSRRRRKAFRRQAGPGRSAARRQGRQAVVQCGQERHAPARRANRQDHGPRRHRLAPRGRAADRSGQGGGQRPHPGHARDPGDARRRDHRGRQAHRFDPGDAGLALSQAGGPVDQP
jgi:outer membrane protein insertion porin family